MKPESRQPSVLVKNSQRALPFDVAELQRFGAAALQEACRVLPRSREAVCAIREIIVVLVSDRRIAELHRRFMNIAGPTDVITFQHGEIYISVETAMRHANEYATKPEDEIRLYVVHGILHLLGLEDTTEEAAKVMEETQARIVKAAAEVARRIADRP